MNLQSWASVSFPGRTGGGGQQKDAPWEEMLGSKQQQRAGCTQQQCWDVWEAISSALSQDSLFSIFKFLSLLWNALIVLPASFSLFVLLVSCLLGISCLLKPLSAALFLYSHSAIGLSSHAARSLSGMPLDLHSVILLLFAVSYSIHRSRTG